MGENSNTVQHRQSSKTADCRRIDKGYRRKRPKVPIRDKPSMFHLGICVFKILY